MLTGKVRNNRYLDTALNAEAPGKNLYTNHQRLKLCTFKISKKDAIIEIAKTKITILIFLIISRQQQH